MSTFHLGYPKARILAANASEKRITRRLPSYRLIDLHLLIAINLEPRT